MSLIEISQCHEADVFWTERQEKIAEGHYKLKRVAHCVDCQAECQVDEVCETCRGTGEIDTDESDGEGHTMRGVGTTKCPDCTPDPEPYEDS